jgi:small-conductance mechanosensitive channel
MLRELAQREHLLKEESEKHKQQIISIEREHQEKVLTYLFWNLTGFLSVSLAVFHTL